MGKKPIVSVTYENESISIKNSLPYLKCLLRLSCVVHEPIYGRFMFFFYVNGFLAVNLYRYATMSMLIFRAWVTCVYTESSSAFFLANREEKCDVTLPY